MPVKHGGARRKAYHPLYRTWLSMRERCSNTNHRYWHRYGGRGIRVCEAWNDFSQFLQDMGPRPLNHTLDRIDVNGDYCPENCRWVPGQFQARNISTNVELEFAGYTRCIAEWAECTGIPKSTISRRLEKGWDIEQVLTTPVTKKDVELPNE